MNKAGVESSISLIAFLLLSYMIAVLAPSLFNPRMILIIIIIGTFYFFGRARDLGVNYYSRFHFTILGCLLMTLLITTIIMLQTTSQYRDLSAQSIKLQIPFCLVLYLSLLSSLGLSWN